MRPALGQTWAQHGWSARDGLGVLIADHVCTPLAYGYVKNKAGLTGQTVPGWRIPGHWPYPGPGELAETEPCVPGLIDVPFFPTSACWPSSAGMAAPTLAYVAASVCRLSCSVLQPAVATAKHAHSPRTAANRALKDTHGLNQSNFKRYGDRDDGRK